jgi:hypothetical protein
MLKSIKAVLALVVAIAAFAGIATQAQAASFGADVKENVQPSNASQPHACYGNDKCTWVLDDAYGNPGGEKAPKSGTLKKIKLIAGAPGSFRLQLVEVNDPERSAQVITNGPRIRYEGQDDPNADTYDVESFKVDVPVHKGEQLAIATKRTSTLRCSSGGPNTLLYNPVLQVGNAAQLFFHADGCWMLIEGVVK